MSRTVVITGATSGIGRAAARAFAGRGNRLVLAARSPDTLAEVREECRAAGAPVLAVPTDVTTPDAVDGLARAALAEFGGIDVWVHTAAPYLSGYLAAKWGLRGLGRALQQEARETPGVNVCLVNPGSVDTPVYRQAANYLGRVGRPPLPITTPERVARAIVDCADRPRREVSVGRLNVVMRFAFTVLPGVYDVLVGPLMRLAGLSNRPVAPHDGIVFTPNPAGESVRGGWLPELSQVVRSVGGMGATVGSAVRRRLG